MSARPPPDPRGARLRDLVLALLEGSLIDTGARAPNPVTMEGAGTAPPSMRWGMAPTSVSSATLETGGDAGAPPPSRRWGLIPAPKTAPPSSAAAEVPGDASPPSRRWGLIPATPPPSDAPGDASPPSRRWGLLPGSGAAESAGDLSPPSRRWGLMPAPHLPSPLPEGVSDASPPSRRWAPIVPPPEVASSGQVPVGLKIPSDGDALEQALAGFDTISFELRTLRAAFAEANRRLTQCMDVIVALVSFDYDKKADVYDRSDIFDGIAAGLNMLGEELSATTVSKAYVDNIIESMSDLLIVTSRDARIKTANQSACDLVGYTKEELANRSIEELFPDLSAADLLSTGGVRDQERDCQRKDGSTVRVAFSASVLRDKRSDGQGLVCVARDLTDKLRTEEERWRLQAAIQRQSIILEELSTPLIPITNEILVMPLIGTVDEQRAAQMVDTLLQGVVSRKTAVAILDITGIRTMDAQGVQGILKAVQAVRLVGAQTVITGVRPEVARLLVAQGYDLSNIKTFGSLQHGIVHAMKRGAAASAGNDR